MSQRRGIRKPLLVLAFTVALALLAPAGAWAASISSPNNPPYETDQLTGVDDPGLSPTREWLRCDPQGDNCSVVATGQTYTLTQDDVAATIRFRFDCLLCTPSTSSATGVVQEASPGITAQPTFTRTGTQQRTLNAQPVNTSGKPAVTVGRQWLRCEDSSPSSCANIGGAAGQTYKLSTPDIGKRIRLRATASNSVGPNATETSDEIGPIDAAPPTVGTLPRISGTAATGSRLSSTQGTFGGEQPISILGRAWSRCTDSTVGSCTPIPGATGSTYTLGQADLGKRIRVAVTAQGLGTRTALSAPTGVVSVASSPVFPDVPPSTPAPTPTASPDVLSPFPRIGIAGRARRTSTRLTKFLVRAPRGARITVRCRGRGCPFRRASARAGRRAVRFRRLQRSLRRGTVVEVFITSPGKIGKYARFRFRRRRAPVRVDGCLQPGARRPSPCP